MEVCDRRMGRQPEPIVIVPVIGSPASGKSTVVSGLLASPGGRVFRLREHARRRAEQDPALAAAVETTADELGWFADEIAMHLLDEAVAWARADSEDRLLLLENYPGGACEAEHVAAIATSGGAGAVEVIELVAPDVVVRRRARARLACAVCDPDLHRPAQVRPDGTSICGSCGSRLQDRASDSASVFDARLARFRDRVEGIRAAFTDAGVRVHRIPADADQDVCLDAARHVIRGLLERSSE